MSNWVYGNWYVFKTIPGQHVIKVLPNEKKTRVVEILCECTRGPMAGQKVRFSGYLNTPQNAARARTDLITMGWRGTKWGDWNGLGVGREFEARVMADEGRDGRTYPRAAFPRPMRNITRTELAASDTELDALNAELGDFATLDAIAEAQAHDAANEAAQANGDGDIPF